MYNCQVYLLSYIIQYLIIYGVICFWQTFEVMNAEKLKQLEAQVRIGGKVCCFSDIYRT